MTNDVDERSPMTPEMKEIYDALIEDLTDDELIARVNLHARIDDVAELIRRYRVACEQVAWHEGRPYVHAPSEPEVKS
jgi:hypothetical protein